MPTTAQNLNGPRIVSNFESLSAEDFETASIRSAAPSYVSEAPSYHSTAPHNEPIPDYSPPAMPSCAASISSGASGPTIAATITSGQSSQTTSASISRPSSLLSPPDETTPTTLGLPPVPSRPCHAEPLVPHLSAFRIPSWSAIGTGNPAARQYQNVAHRRASAAADTFLARRSNSSMLGSIAESSSEQQSHQDNTPRRPLEDPYLVGEVAARQARSERLARENGDEILVMEDRRWDFFLAQLKDWEARERSWNRFHRDYEARRGRLGRRLGLR